jgi:hypothetical protein
MESDPALLPSEGKKAQIFVNGAFGETRSAIHSDYQRQRLLLYKDLRFFTSIVSVDRALCAQ